MQTAKQNWFEDKCQERGQPKPNSSEISYQAVKELTKRKQDRDWGIPCRAREDLGQVNQTNA